MTVAYDNVLCLLGKQVSFLYVFQHKLEEYCLEYDGVVTDVLIHLDKPVEICIDSGNFYVLEELDQFTIDS